MKKYSRTELYQLCKSGDVKQICEELYDTLYIDTPYTVMRSGDKFIMNILRDKRNKLKSNNQNASIFIIHNDIPCLVIHRENDKECKSISSILYPFQSEENVCGIIYKIHDVREILDILSYDDTNIKFHGNYRPLYSFGCVGTNFGGTY